MRRSQPVLALLALVLGMACTPSTPRGTAGGSATEARPAPAQGGATGTTAAAPTEWEQTLARGKEEGKVVVYGTAGDLLRKNMTEGFRRAFPEIAIEWSGMRPPEQAARMEAERRGGVYAVDAFEVGTTTALTQLKPAGALDPIRPALLWPEAVDPRFWRGQQWEFADDDETTFVYTIAVKSNVMYTPGQVTPDQVDETFELLDPKWKGKIVINDPTISGAGQSSFRFLWQAMGPERAAQYIRALAAQEPVVDRDERRQVEWIARGRYQVLLGFSDTTSQQLRQEGMQVGVVTEFKDYGSAITSSGGNVVLINKAPHPNAAKVFINWLLTKDGQTAFSTAVNLPAGGWTCRRTTYRRIRSRRRTGSTGRAIARTRCTCRRN
jgi:ABC-type Fe3+ transport system substrate-binding protein